MQLKKIKTKKDYQIALTRFEKIFQAKAGTPESDEADVLSVLLKDYEDHNFLINTPDPIDAIWKVLSVIRAVYQIF
jgi:HTH-type transcriptional regulator / antitoxin HigA